MNANDYYVVPPTKAVVVGEGAFPEVAGFEVVETQVVAWAGNFLDVRDQFFALLELAHQLGAKAVLFQSTPAMLTATLYRMALDAPRIKDVYAQSPFLYSGEVTVGLMVYNNSGFSHVQWL